jgi:hypothetical protein
MENPHVTSTTGRTGDDGPLLLDRISDRPGEEQSRERMVPAHTLALLAKK